MISIIVATDKNGLIGNGDKIPWHLPADFAYFKKKTLGHPVIMGRKTYDSIGKPLPGRDNIVITREDIEIEGVRVAHSIKEVVDLAKESSGSEEIFIIGGAGIYVQTIDLVDRIYITYVDGEFNGDIYFPKIKEEEWEEISRDYRQKDDKNAYDMDFVVLDRKRA